MMYNGLVLHVYIKYLTRMTGASEFTDNEGRIWIGTFNGRKAQGLTLKLS